MCRLWLYDLSGLWSRRAHDVSLWKITVSQKRLTQCEVNRILVCICQRSLGCADMDGITETACCVQWHTACS